MLATVMLYHLINQEVFAAVNTHSGAINTPLPSGSTATAPGNQAQWSAAEFVPLVLVHSRQFKWSLTANGNLE